MRDGKGLAAAGGADIILSTSNSTKSMIDSIQGLRPDGRLVTMGVDAEPLSVSLFDLLVRRLRIIGSQQNGPEYLYEALDFVAQGKVKTIVETYPSGGSCESVSARGGRQGAVSRRADDVGIRINTEGTETQRTQRMERTERMRSQTEQKAPGPRNGSGRPGLQKKSHR